MSPPEHARPLLKQKEAHLQFNPIRIGSNDQFQSVHLLMSEKGPTGDHSGAKSTM